MQAMRDLCMLVWYIVIGPFRSQAALQAEVLVLRHQLNVLRRESPERIVLTNVGRLVFVALYGLAPKVLDALKILKPETVIRCIAAASAPIGVGNPSHGVGGALYRPKFVSLSAR